VADEKADTLRVSDAPDPVEADANGELRADLERLTQQLQQARRLVVEMEAESRELREELARCRGSASARVAVMLQQGARRLAPYGTRRGAALHSAAQSAAVLLEQGPRGLAQRIARGRRSQLLQGEFPDTPEGRRRQYLAWLDGHEPRGERLSVLRDAEQGWTYRPTISLLMPVCDPEAAWLQAAIASVRAQVYGKWELCVADDASTDPSVRDVIERSVSADLRIRATFRERRGGITAASGDALEMATGDWIGFVDHDDVLRPHALHAVVSHLQGSRDADVCYSDEDKILVSGERGDPLFKPDWAPEMLLSSNYITHFVIVRRDLFEKAGGLRPGFDGSQDHDLLLRATELSSRVSHVPDVLYSWRMVPGSAALSSEFKPLAREAGRRAVEDALARRGLEGRVTFGRYPGFYDVDYAIGGTPRIAIVIPTRDRLELLRAAVASIEANTTYGNYHIVIVDNQSGQPETLDYLRRTMHSVVRFTGAFNFSAIVNAAAESVDCDHLLLLNNDVTVNTPRWIESMLMHSQRADVGAVGARLVYADGRVQHEGIVIGRLHDAANVELGWPGVREVSAVTGACLMTRRSVFEELGGFDVALAEAFNDVDYCLRAREHGYRVVFTPLAELTHREGASRGRRIPALDRAHFVARWGGRDALQDPYLNVNVLWPKPLRLRF
jgi:O-antigen biosynthesis protein